MYDFRDFSRFQSKPKQAICWSAGVEKICTPAKFQNFFFDHDNFWKLQSFFNIFEKFEFFWKCLKIVDSHEICVWIDFKYLDPLYSRRKSRKSIHVLQKAKTTL